MDTDARRQAADIAIGAMETCSHNGMICVQCVIIALSSPSDRMRKIAKANKLATRLVDQWVENDGVLGGDLLDPDTDKMKRDIATLLLREDRHGR